MEKYTMKKLFCKKYLFLLIVVMMLGMTGCGKKQDNDIKQTDVPKQTDAPKQTELPKESKTTGEVVQYSFSQIIVTDDEETKEEKEIVPNGLVKDYETWEQIAKDSPSIGLAERFNEGRYNEEFFEENMLAYYITTTSGGMQYEFDGATFTEEEGKKVLNIKLTYSEEAIVNSLAGYYIFVEMEKDEKITIEEIKLETICRN